MSKILITISDGENGMINYKSECNDETYHNGEPSPALALALMLIQYIEEETLKLKQKQNERKLK